MRVVLAAEVHLFPGRGGDGVLIAREPNRIHIRIHRIWFMAESRIGAAPFELPAIGEGELSTVVCPEGSDKVNA